MLSLLSGGFAAKLLLVVVVIAVIGILTTGYVKAPADKAYIITGFRKKPRILIGQAGIRIPFLERKDELLLKQISVDIKTSNDPENKEYIPTKDFIGVDIDAIAKVCVDTKHIELAMKNFLNMNAQQICAALTDSLQGNMREIIGTQELAQLCTSRAEFGNEVQRVAQKDMNALGIEIISCNIQKIVDERGLIGSLGQENMSQIQKNASIAKANADSEVLIAQAEAKERANQKEIETETVIAQRNNDLAIRKAELKKDADAKQAEADAAYEIQKQTQEKTIQEVTVDAQIARAKKDAELEAEKVAIRQQSLTAEINKKADADKYAIERAAEAEKEKAARAADAERYAMEQRAAGIKAQGEAEAQAIRAKGLAEAEALEKKAEAMQKYGKAAMMEMVVKALPDMAKAVAEPLSAIDKVTIIDSGNGESGVGSVGGYVPAVLAKTIESVKEATGLDLKEVMKADTYDAKVKREITIDGPAAEEAVKAVKTRRKTVPSDNAKFENHGNAE